MRKGSRNPKYSIDLVLRQGRIIYRKEIRKILLWRSTTDRQERDRKGKKSQENTRKKGMKAI